MLNLTQEQLDMYQNEADELYHAYKDLFIKENVKENIPDLRFIAGFTEGAKMALFMRLQKVNNT
jgi:hypothetical protein